jgi:hypothetical protein
VAAVDALVRTSTGWKSIRGDPGSIGPPGPPGIDLPASANPDQGSVLMNTQYGEDWWPPFWTTRRINGTINQYAGIPVGVWIVMSNGSTPLRFDITPPFPAWCELGCQVFLQKVSAEYTLGYARILLSPADEDGCNAVSAVVTQHSTVQTYESRPMIRTFRLAQGQTYAATAELHNAGGSFQYYQGPNHMHFEYKMWPQ